MVRPATNNEILAASMRDDVKEVLRDCRIEEMVRDMDEEQLHDAMCLARNFAYADSDHLSQMIRDARGVELAALRALLREGCLAWLNAAIDYIDKESTT